MIDYKFEKNVDRTPSRMTSESATYLMNIIKSFYEERTQTKVSDIELKTVMCDFLIWLKENNRYLPSAISAEEIIYLLDEYIAKNYKED